MSERKAGRDLDAEIAEKVMGWTFVTFPDGACPEIKHWHAADGAHVSLRPFSTSIADAWQVVEKMNDERAWSFEMERVGGEDQETGVRFGGNSGFVYAQTAPLAICLAALAATSADRGDER